AVDHPAHHPAQLEQVVGDEVVEVFVDLDAEHAHDEGVGPATVVGREQDAGAVAQGVSEVLQALEVPARYGHFGPQAEGDEDARDPAPECPAVRRDETVGLGKIALDQETPPDSTGATRTCYPSQARTRAAVSLAPAPLPRGAGGKDPPPVGP